MIRRRRRPPVKRLSHSERAARRATWVTRVSLAEDKHSTIAEIAATEHVNVATVQMACRNAGIEILKRQGPKAHRAMEILAGLLRGERETDVAARLGITRQRVNQVAIEARKAGINV